MSVLNFSVVDILPYLLDKSKQQTIRPAWKKITFRGKIPINANDYTEEKPPRFKVGETVKLLWNQRSKYKIFCRKCGNGLEDGKNPNIIQLTHYKNKCGCVADLLYKHLGNVKITAVFKISIQIDDWMKKLNLNNSKYWITGYPYKSTDTIKIVTNDLAKRDGFSTAEQMFKAIDKLYDLSEAKEFYVYRWTWK